MASEGFLIGWAAVFWFGPRPCKKGGRTGLPPNDSRVTLLVPRFVPNTLGHFLLSTSKFMVNKQNLEQSQKRHLGFVHFFAGQVLWELKGLPHFVPEEFLPMTTEA